MDTRDTLFDVLLGVLLGIALAFFVIASVSVITQPAEIGLIEFIDHALDGPCANTEIAEIMGSVNYKVVQPLAELIDNHEQLCSNPGG